MNRIAVKKIPLNRAKLASVNPARPILILTINNGAAHNRAAEAIATAWREINPSIPARIVEVSALMSPLARFTHVSAYLWLVKNAPQIWEKIDRYQKRQTNTSPEWFYRRECRKIFDLAREIQPVALVATEVGCGEIAALIKRDLDLKIPLAAVSLDADADRAWIQPETDFYSVTSAKVKKDFENLGADTDKINALGAPLQTEFFAEVDRKTERGKVFAELGLPEKLPLVLIAGGGEGLGEIREIAALLLESKTAKSIVVLAGNNWKLKRDGEKLAAENKNLRVLGWTNDLARIYRAADILIGKLGLTFYEATACGLPIIALEPPPGAEQIQFENLNATGAGRAAKSLTEAIEIVEDLLENPEKLGELKSAAKNFVPANAAEKLARWLAENVESDVCFQAFGEFETIG